MIIKASCEDFLVGEIPLDSLYQDEAAHHHVYLLKKTNYTTQRAVAHIAKALKIPQKNIGFAGTKDKQAITTQYISIARAKKEHVLGVELKDIELTFVGYRKERLALGELKGNRFSLLVKEVEFDKEVPSTFYVPNYFDEQRFSTHNVQLGMCLLKRKYKEAVEIIIENDNDHKETFEEHLNRHKNDYIGALRILPRKILLFYVHAVQSILFNKQLVQYMQELTDCKTVAYSEGEFSFPKELLIDVEEQEGELVGYDSVESIEDVEPYDFINKSFPEISLSGAKRPLFSQVHDCQLQQEEQGVRVSFYLGKGSYATIVLKQLFSKE